ncbi:MAG: hypothetical protein ACYTFQ_14200 [Planctomycetota bacterium]
MSAYRAGVDSLGMITHGCDLVRMRNDVAHKAIKDDGVDYLWMQDADNWSPMGGGPLMPMLETMQTTGAVAVFAIVSMRTRPPRANVWPCKPGKVYELEKAGTGMVLIDLKQIRPWYDSYPGPLFGRIYSDAKQHTARIGLDIFFTKLMRGKAPDGSKPSLKVVCDGRIPTVHADATHPHEYDGNTYPEDTGIGAPTAGERQS